MLSASRGVHTAFAFGGCVSRRRFCGCLDTFNLTLFTIDPGKPGGYAVLNEGSLLHGFPGLRADRLRLGAAANCARFVESVVVDAADGRAAFDLLTETLYALESADAQHDFVPLLFRARLAFEQGMRPTFTACAACGKDLSSMRRPRFSVEKGQVLCRDCAVAARADAQGGEPPREAAPGVLRALDWVATSRPADWPRLGLLPEARRQFARIVEQFTAFHLGLSWEEGRYKKV